MTGTDLETRISVAYSAHCAGRIAEAESGYRSVLLDAPHQVDALYLLSSLLLAGRPEEAARLAAAALDASRGRGGIGISEVALLDHRAACLRAVEMSSDEADCLAQGNALEPCNAVRLFLLAEALRRSNRREEAIDALENCVRIAPQDINARSNLGALQLQSGRVDAAVASLEAVLSENPDHFQAINNLGNAYSQQQRLDRAAELYRRAVELQPRFVEAWVNLGGALHTLGRLDQAREAFQRALELDPASRLADDGLNGVLAKIVPRWHFVMMNDRRRNETYDAAIRRAVERRQAAGDNPIVLDIGAGSGLLSMMAARAGAAHVVTCEMVQPVAEMAREIIARNGYDEIVTLHARKSTLLQVGRDLPRRADILVSEIFDVGLLGEYVLPVLAHARRNLLVEGAEIVPARATVWMMPIDSTEIHEVFVASNANACGFEFEAFNRFASRGYDQLAIRRYAYAPIAEPRPVFEFDFRSDVPDRETVLEFLVARDGKVHAWVFWFVLDFGAGQTFDTGPFSAATCWSQAVQVEQAPLSVQAGMPLRVAARQTQTTIAFRAEAWAAGR